MSEFPCDGPIDANVHVISGSVVVIAEERSTALVTIEPEHNNDSGRAAAEATRVEMIGNTLIVEVPSRSVGFIRRSSSLRVSVRLPLDSRVDVKTASSDITMTGRFGSCTTKTASGDVRIDDVTGTLTANTASGDIEFGHVGGNVNLHTASGTVRAKAAGGDLVFRSASGDATIGPVGGSVEVNTASGDLRIGSVHTGSTHIITVSGKVEIGVAEGTSVWLDVNTLSGDTRSELAVTDGAPAGNPATLNLQIRTVSGDVLIRRAAAVSA